MPEGEPHVSAGQLGQRVVDRAEVELEIIRRVRGQRGRIGGLQLPPRDTHAGVVGGRPCRVPLLRGIALREKGIQPVFVLAAQRVGNVGDAGRYRRTDHRGQRPGTAVAATAAQQEGRACGDSRRASPQCPDHRCDARGLRAARCGAAGPARAGFSDTAHNRRAELSRLAGLRCLKGTSPARNRRQQ